MGPALGALYCINGLKLVWDWADRRIIVDIIPLGIRISKRNGARLAEKRPITPGYVLFYILFLPDTWQILIGVIVAYFVTPLVLSADMATSSQVMVYLMMATIGYAASRAPARGITRMIKKKILGDRHPK